MSTEPANAVSRRLAVSAFGFGGIGLALVAQPQTMRALEGEPQTDPIVGVWQWTSFPDAHEPATFAIFHPDGTYIEWNPGPGVAIGIWRRTAPGVYDLLFVFADADPSPDYLDFGTSTFTVELTLGEDGDSLTGEGTIDVRDAGGVQLVKVPWIRPAVRLTFERNPSTGSIPATPEAQ